MLTISAVAFCGRAFSFSADSIAAMGRFPAFCVNVYRNVDRFINSTDSAYVCPSGYAMNVKLRSAGWTDFNSFYFDGDDQIRLHLPFTATVGCEAAFMGLSLGYDISVNRLFGAVDRAKLRINFEFSSALLAGRFYSMRNADGMRLSYLAGSRDIDCYFNGMETDTWGLEAFYFFNSRKYSYAAATTYGRIQKKSQGSFITGLAYQHQKLDFDFSRLPESLKPSLPEEWRNLRYAADGDSFSIAGGYGFNWVPRQKYNVGIIAVVMPTLNYGFLNSARRNYSFRINYRLTMSAIYNHDRWFGGVVVKSDLANIYSRHSTLTSALWVIEAKIGWRFNIR
ncbi:MAG: DUF4421 domain-containing protein [Muribaculaceae bacterium]|nr:DUF4421 domain-containing protein [Muribaculaceae bacterium]